LPENLGLAVEAFEAALSIDINLATFGLLLGLSFLSAFGAVF
jgi:hypothetical protein